VWTLAKVALQPLEQRQDIRTCAERKVLAANHAVPARIAEIRLLSGYRAWNVYSNRYVFLGYPHRVFLPVPVNAMVVTPLPLLHL
jgi:hypothetical protein